MISHFVSKLAGGAGIAALRIHESLVRHQIDSRVYYGEGYSSDPRLNPFYPQTSFLNRNMAALATSWRNRQDAPEGRVVSPKWTRKTPLYDLGAATEVIHLHSILKWLHLPSFFASLPSEIPVVWTLHDLIPITGGCTYTGDCLGFTKSCGNCPQLKWPYSYDASRRFFRIKEKWYKKLNLHFIGNSEWTTDQARKSALGKLARSIRTIPLGLDTNQFIPVDKTTARKALGIADEKFILGFACSDFSEKRKGADLLRRALERLPSENILLLILGTGVWPRGQDPVETISLGGIGNPRLQSLFYSALDVFAMPTQVETFGMVAMEAMACETPVVCYEAGGLTDVVTNGVTGLMDQEIGSVSKLVEMLTWMIAHPADREKMGRAAREDVINKFSFGQMAQKYSKLYTELINNQKNSFNCSAR
jgi:glycosyltransferase involved in cell wall biosynthesis